MSEGNTQIDYDDTKAQSSKFVDKDARMMAAYTSLTQSEMSMLKKNKNGEPAAATGIKPNQQSKLKLAKPLQLPKEM